MTEQNSVLRILFLSIGMELCQDTHEIFKPSLCQYSTRSQTALDILLRKTNTGQKSWFFLRPKIWSQIDPSIKNVRTSSFLCMLLRKIFYFICKANSNCYHILWLTLSFDSFIATLFFLVIIGIFLSRSSYFKF